MASIWWGIWDCKGKIKISRNKQKIDGLKIKKASKKTTKRETKD